MPPAPRGAVSQRLSPRVCTEEGKEASEASFCSRIFPQDSQLSHGSSLSLRLEYTEGSPSYPPPDPTPCTQEEGCAPKGLLVQEVPCNRLGPEPQDEQRGQEAGVQEKPGGKDAAG